MSLVREPSILTDLDVELKSSFVRSRPWEPNLGIGQTGELIISVASRKRLPEKSLIEEHPQVLQKVSRDIGVHFVPLVSVNLFVMTGFDQSIR